MVQWLRLWAPIARGPGLIRGKETKMSHASTKTRHSQINKNLWKKKKRTGQYPTKLKDWVAYPFSRGSSRPSNRTGSPALQADSLPAELLGKPRNGIYTVKFAIWVRETQKTQSRTIAVSRCRSNWARIPKVPYLREESVLKTSDSWLHPLGHLSLSTRLLRGQIWKGHWRI